METCRSIVDIDRTNSGEAEPMGRQIYETFRHRPNTVNNHELETWENFGKLQGLFDDLTTKNALFIVSTITPSDRLDITSSSTPRG